MNENLFNFFDFFDFAVNLPRNRMRVNPRTFDKLIGDRMMMKSVLVGLFVAAVMVVAGCADSDDSGSGGGGDSGKGPGGGGDGDGVSLNTKELVLGLDKSENLIATPADAAVTWTSNKEDVATVVNGTVTGKGVGTAIISAAIADGGKPATCAVSVVFAVVANREEWVAALTKISTEEADGDDADHPNTFEIHITKDFEAAGISTGSITGNNKKVLLTGSGTIKLASAGSLIRTVANQKFVIDGPALEGGVAGNKNPLVYIGGGTVELANGEIKGNVNNAETSDNYGGGVHVAAAGTFTMTDGIIGGNNFNSTGGGVYVDGGTFEMYDGTISGNQATNGGGVYVHGNGGIFTMKGGTIGGLNQANGGGGVCVNNGTFNMDGGTISGNQGHPLANVGGGSGGGGVQVSGGTFTMKGGTIEKNDSGNGGGGVQVYGGTFNMEGGTIEKNTTSTGGGVQVGSKQSAPGSSLVGGTFTMKDGTISGNTSGQGGGGVYVVSGTFTMNAGTIDKNSCSDGNNGVQLPSGTFDPPGGAKVQDDN
jgi:hypothetical protein